MTMTIAVYRIDPRTGVRTQVRPLRTVEPPDVPELFGRFPPCACPLCRAGTDARLRAQVAEVNRRSRGAL
ncbi:hypothetical protein [Streptomyces sp. NPDC059894]|uniref:hypothetical protein n=1 Tax=unclassified Streptomyces TaxID=2593676 RepID=UPI00364894A1